MFNAMCEWILIRDQDAVVLAAYNAELSFALARLLTRSLTCLQCFTHTPQKTKKRRHAKSPGGCRQTLGRKDASLAKLASEHVPKQNHRRLAQAKGSRHRMNNDNNNGGGSQTRRNGRSPNKKNANSDLAEREERNHESTQETFIEENSAALEFRWIQRPM
jgi:hypothetical protein